MLPWQPKFQSKQLKSHMQPGFVAQWVVSLIADPGDVSLIPAWPHTFTEIDCEIFSLVIDILLLPLIQGLLSVTSKECELSTG